MKRLMNTDMRVAKVMLRLMKNDLQKLVKDDRKMRELVVKVMKDITKRKTKVGNREDPHVNENDKQAGTSSEVSNVDKNDKQAGTSEVSNVDGNHKQAGTSEVSNVDGNDKQAGTSEVSNMDEKDKQVSEVLEKLMAETINEFKKLMQNDEKMAIAAMHLLETHKEKGKFKELTEMDKDVAEIIAKARKMSDNEEIPSDNHDDENGTTDNVVANVDTLRNKVKNMLKPVRELILNEEVLKTFPENVRLGVEAMDVVIGNRKELKAELMDSDNINSHRNCCCCVISYNYFSDRYDMSVAADTMLVTIEELSGSKPEIKNVTRRKPRDEMGAIPTDYVGLDSRNKLFGKIIVSLASNGVNAIGVFGMGGSGKTTLAIEVANSKANGIFDTAVMVEISESPNIESIQNQIGDGLGLDLNNVHGIHEKAVHLHDRLKAEGRKEDNKSKKILIVLDNIWKKIDLAQIGIIPHEYCKLLLTSREMDVCKTMIVNEANIFEVGLLNEAEAKDLFQSQVKRKVHSGEYKFVADRLLKKCRGLPLAIVATANSLKGKELPLWRQFAEELERPISCQITGARYETFSILRTSYEAMASEEKKKFFLMACLSPIGSSISIDNLMRYGIGLDLFQHVNQLSEAIETARTWAEELVSSSMLLKGDTDEYVKIHDVVRESTMSFASKSGTNTDGQLFLVDVIPRWICEETFSKYTGISLLAQANYVLLSGVKADLLQILLLKGNKNNYSVLESNFFQGMRNLKVLEMLFMNFEKGLPESLSKLKVLKTLHLVECELGDINLIGELGSLLVLSLRGSSLEGLPDEIGKLYKLRLLDMSNCRCKEPRIPANVIARLSLLEGLYLVDRSLTSWGVMESTSNDIGIRADMEEFNKLKFLNILEIRMLGPISLPIGAQFVENLDKFQVIVGEEDIELQPSQCALMVSKFDVSQELKMDNCLKALLKKADFLALKSAAVNNIVPELDEEGYRDLSRLELSNIHSISRICEGKAPTELFFNLCHLKVSELEKLEELLPVNPLPLKLITLKISNCNSLTYIFSEDDGVNKESDIIELPCLKTLKLDEVSKLTSMVKPSNNDDSRHPSFFNSKVTLTSLEELSLENNKRIVKLWDKESNVHGFQNLKVLEIDGCEEVETIGPLSMFLSLVQLESLTIKNCKKMQQVISDESETLEIPNEIITFPKLEYLWILDMETLECFYGGSYKMVFPRLKDLTLYSLESMTEFARGDNSTGFFPKTIEFPSLESLWLEKVSDEVRVLWDFHEEEGQGISSNPLPNLKTLKVQKIKVPSIVFPSLSYLQVETVVGNAKFLFSSSSENEGCVGTFSQFPKLEHLYIQGCPGSVKQFIEEDGSTAILNFCGQLRRLNLESALNMEVVSLHLFKSLRDVSISDLACEYLFSADGGFLQLQSLEHLKIEKCPNLEVIIRGGDKDTTVVFPRLKRLNLRDLERMTKLCSISDIPLHFPSLDDLDIYSCNKLESLFCGEPNQVLELPSLEQVTIRKCDAMKSFSTRPLKSAKLRKLEVYNCPEMEWFLSGNSSCNADLELPSLEEVTIRECPNMKSFSPALLRAPRLRKLIVVECNKWEWLFDGEPNQVVELPSLEEVAIEECDAMKSFSTRPLKAPKLRDLYVFYCPEMEWFLSGNSNCNAYLELPSLEIVDIMKCPKMKSFSPAVLRASKLQLVKVDNKPYSIAEIEDLNHVLQSANSREQTDKTDL
ncbi:uncharacterized protein LOC141637841 isoform X2 [Silene latifolia]